MDMDMGMDHSSDGVPGYDPNAPWYWRVKPGRTGALMPHFYASSAFFVGSMFMFCQIIIQARNLSAGQSYAEHYIPIRDVVFLRRAGTLVVVLATLMGLFFIVTYPGPDPADFLTHFTLASSYLPIGICIMLEGFRKVPFDTHRKTLVLALWIHALIWSSHAQMKKLMVDQMMHTYLVYIICANALITMYSVHFTSSVSAYLASWGFILFQSLWILLTGFYESWIDITMHDVAAIWGLMAMGLFLVIVAVYAASFSHLTTTYPSDKDETVDKQGIDRLLTASTEDDDDDDERHDFL